MKINSRATTYNIENKSAYIITLQKMLDIPLSGKLDGRTKERIEQFKNEHRITSDCRVDFRTFEMIKCNKAKCEHTCADDIFLPYECSRRFRDVAEALCIVIEYYSLPLRLPKGDVYGYDAIRAVKRLREIYRLHFGDVIDGEFLYYLQRDIKSINAMKKQDHNR